MNIGGVKLHGPSLGIGCVLGAAAGVAGGFALCRLVLLPKLQRDFDAQVDDRVEEEAGALRSHYENKLNERIKEALAGVVSGEQGTDSSTDEGAAVAGRKAERGPAINYAGIRPASGPPQAQDPRLEGLDDGDDEQHIDAAGVEDTDAAEAHNVFADHPADGEATIRRVTRDEFGEVPPGYTTEVLTWYAADGILCDEKDDPIRQPLLLIGTERPPFGYLPEDPHVCLFINDDLDLCLEVIYKESSWADAQLGYGNPAMNREAP